MDLGLKGKRALVMGASSGIGRAIAEGLSHEGAVVAICARDEGRLSQASREMGAKISIPCDVSKPGASRALVEKVIEALGGIDVLVTNTGGPPKGGFLELSTPQWEEGFRNLWMSAVEAMRASILSMRASGWGRIVLVTSVAAREPMPGLTVSNGLRAGLLGLTKSVSQEVAKDGITVNALLPGYTDTERLRELGIPNERMTAQVPAGRLGEPNEIADLAVFLASKRAAYVTGQAIACDGGYLRGI